jgi:tRNA 2-thiocytidine biosynthesis protein TtcA
MVVLEKKLLKKLKTAIFDFDMIKEWETVLLWVSWWKDSMVLWYLLSQYRKHSKEKFNIKAIYIFKNFLIDCDINFLEKKKYFEEELWIPLEKVDINLPSESKLNEWLGQSCQWCAYARRIAMFKLCEKYWATKIIYGHHMDDIVVTSFMNMIEWKNLKIMPIKNKMSMWDITFIRPMAYIREKDILKFAQLNQIPFSGCNCPVWTDWNRNKIKHQIIRENEKIIPKFVENTFWALIKDFREKYEKDWYTM